MAVKRRRSKHRAALDADQLAWLAGSNKDCGFVQFQSDEVLRALFDEFGDKDIMIWNEGMNLPKRKQDDVCN